VKAIELDFDGLRESEFSYQTGNRNVILQQITSRSILSGDKSLGSRLPDILRERSKEGENVEIRSGCESLSQSATKGGTVSRGLGAKSCQSDSYEGEYRSSEVQQNLGAA
jgi:hypothetical protein